MSDANALLPKAFTLLRLLAAAGQRGEALTSLANQSGQPHSTVHRLLHQLIDERMVVQITETRRYALGPMAFELGVAAHAYDLRALARPLLESLARETEDTAFLSLRSGDESVCIDLQAGPSPIRVVTLEIGTRRPLGAGAGGLAILASLGAQERAHVVARVQPALESVWGVSAAMLARSIAHADEEGYALIRNRVHAGISGVGHVVRGAWGQPLAALSIATLNERIRPTRMSLLVRSLREAALELQKKLSDARAPARRGQGRPPGLDEGAPPARPRPSPAGTHATRAARARRDSRSSGRHTAS